MMIPYRFKVVHQEVTEGGQGTHGVSRRVKLGQAHGCSNQVRHRSTLPSIQGCWPAFSAASSRQVSRSLRPAPSLATLPTDLGTCVYTYRVRAQSRNRAVSSASSCGSKGPLPNYLGTPRKRRASLPVRSRLIPPCCALRATPAHHLFLTDRCVALYNPRRS